MNLLMSSMQNTLIMGKNVKNKNVKKQLTKDKKNVF